jgi:hypothetical protein
VSIENPLPVLRYLAYTNIFTNITSLHYKLELYLIQVFYLAMSLGNSLT